MRLYQDEHWRGVFFEDRTILVGDSYLYSKLAWEELLHDVEVEPTGDKGYYRACSTEKEWLVFEPKLEGKR